jgi:hypothetical protein
MRINHFDAFAKTVDDFSIKTLTGGILTLASTVLIVVLVVLEYFNYSKVSFSPQLVVDKNRKERMTINLNITFPRLPCFGNFFLTKAAGLDVVDISGEQQINIEHDVHKQRLDTKGQPIAQKFSAKKNKLSANSTAVADCGACYGGIPGTTGCCNSCEEVRDAYNRKGWAFSDPDSIEQVILFLFLVCERRLYCTFKGTSERRL